MGIKSRTNQNNRMPLNVSSEEDDGGYFVKRVDESSAAANHSETHKTISQAALTKQDSRQSYIPQVIPNTS